MKFSKILAYIFIIGYISAVKLPVNNPPQQINIAVKAVQNTNPVTTASRTDTYILQLASKSRNPNDIFRDVTSSEDKYDPLSIPEPEYVDYNHSYESDPKEIENIIRRDLTGEQVSYQFD
jgi:hypothetical protein